MTTLYGKVTQEIVEELIKEDAEWLPFLYDVREKVKSGFYSPDVVNALGQYFYSPELEEYYSFIQLWHHMFAGDLIAARVGVKKGPLKDKFMEANAAVLDAVTWVDWEAAVWGGTQDEDGFINLKSPLVFMSFNLPQMSYVHDENDIVSFPLEIGYQTWSKSVHYLRTVGRLARWPYGSEEVWLFKMRDEVRRAMEDGIIERLGIKRSAVGELVVASTGHGRQV